MDVLSGIQRVTPVRVTLTDTSIETLDLLKSHLSIPGNLIALPTETVYGLAANGLCEKSVLRIFEVKGRPLTDPVILHVPSFEDALSSIFDADLYTACVVLYLSLHFSPGPLTIITRGRSGIPRVVSANSGYPAVRCPNHPDAQAILKHIGFPLAAPSANKFGHISPTTADHVISEFKDVHMYVVDGGSCSLGLESTVAKLESTGDGISADDFLQRHGVTYKHLNAVVASIDLSITDPRSMIDAVMARCSGKIDMPLGFVEELVDHLWSRKDTTYRITILRPGFITEADLKNIFANSLFSVSVSRKTVYSSGTDVCDSPGMILTHYAPSVPTYLISGTVPLGTEKVPANRIVMIDSDGMFNDKSGLFLSYIALGSTDENMAHNLYGALREAEEAALCYNKPLGDLGATDTAIIVISYKDRGTELNATLRDRLIRASSGRTIGYTMDQSSLDFIL
ncbi:Telomere recombination family protein [Babesia bovis T2Bo]|uniref:Threonylcarbamoyl-AMP synthase n=1 Tax=Babesia bovis TaxID=5865 RepID=A7AVF9_BABBO|nr:Telomere recombination family protein [Babesia bovis T2Bo]EDO05785.1 Telomere recombination family protein [Babesia bovis T2Bo]|eukprot:XP_001609353.1 translation factor Sua5 [Babesia bovis T2Bo]